MTRKDKKVKKGKEHVHAREAKLSGQRRQNPQNNYRKKQKKPEKHLIPSV